MKDYEILAVLFAVLTFCLVVWIGIVYVAIYFIGQLS